MAWPFMSMPTIDDLRHQLARRGVSWTTVPDPNDPQGKFDSGFFEHDVGGQKVTCPVSIRRGQPLNPDLVRYIYRRLLLSDDAFEL
jgi:hypothetical protein